MKTPDEIKKGLECCHRYGSCDGCPYVLTLKCGFGDELGCDDSLLPDALACIQQLETKCHQLERERDAAVADIPRACGYCKWFEINRGGNMTECHNPNGCRNIIGINTGWEWRSVKEE